MKYDIPAETKILIFNKQTVEMGYTIANEHEKEYITPIYVVLNYALSSFLLWSFFMVLLRLSLDPLWL